MTPSELCQLWKPKLRKISYTTGLDEQDVLQQAWLLAATMARAQDNDFVPRWLKAVERQVTAQRPGQIIRPTPGKKKQAETFAGTGWLAASLDDDPADILQALQDLEGVDVEQAIQTPQTSNEIALVLGKSVRQARRIKRRLEQLGAAQGDFWGVAA